MQKAPNLLDQAPNLNIRLISQNGKKWKINNVWYCYFNMCSWWAPLHVMWTSWTFHTIKNNHKPVNVWKRFSCWLTKVSSCCSNSSVLFSHVFLLWRREVNSWSHTKGLIDGCRTQMASSRKCCWQISLLLEQFVFSLFTLLRLLLNVEQSLLG